MKHFGLFLFVFIFILSSCATPGNDTLPTPLATSVSVPFSTVAPMSTRTSSPALSGSIVLDTKEAIAYSYRLLLELGLEDGMFYDGADYIPVQFSDGNSGAFIAIGFSGSTRGYQFLYRLREDQVASVQVVKSNVDWGFRRFGERVNIETIALVPGADGQPRWMLKVTGTRYLGPGISTHGYFEIIDVSDGSIRVVFSGQEADINSAGAGGWFREYQYEYVDLDGDDTFEIVEHGEECELEWSEGRSAWVPVPLCETPERTYQFNGIEYVQEP